ncbi:MAG: HD domain-containing protein [Candidatus Micrarchaeia archaeon]
MKKLKRHPDNGRRFCENDDEKGLYGRFSPFFIDSYKIAQSKSLRRLESKTQVYTVPDNPHIRTRLTHTNEVVWISKLIAMRLGLNEYLCEAVALGHDIGHTPYGHPGEALLAKIRPGFRHEKNSIVVLELVERAGKGTNICVETAGGILYHSRGSGRLDVSEKVPQEWNVVMLADKLAYVFSDINDSERLGYLKKLPYEAVALGCCQRERVDNCINALVNESLEKGYVAFSDSKEAKLFARLKDFMYDKVYGKIDGRLKTITLEAIYEIIEKTFKEFDPVLLTSLLTDSEVTALAEKLLDNPLDKRKIFLNHSITGLADILEGLEEIPIINYECIDANWIMKKCKNKL